MTIWVGVDWGGSNHAVCIVDPAGWGLDHFAVAHERDGLADLAACLRRYRTPGETPIPIERPSGLVDVLVEAGFVDTLPYPNVVKACRRRYRADATSSDPGDACIPADILRIEGHRLAPFRPQSDAIKALCALVRGRDNLIARKVVLATQLRALLESYWPGPFDLFADIASPIARAFIQCYPPEGAGRLAEKRMAAFLAQNQYCGRLCSTPNPTATEADAKGELSRVSASTLEGLVAQIAKLSSRIEPPVARLPEGRIVISFPGAGKICAAQITGELGDGRVRRQSEDHLAAEASVASVTYQSGKSRSVGW
ncbi:transposase [Mesorhizobium robiniae]|uniref:Transposase n=1 Tax=Mesorhizobium robiniae TaxID=559315 RepID=A0ABV2GXU3_9HYPH|nr:transposase [Mesorhizobium sp. ZC-5]MCV3243309.1 transposase [Mesorhizobium sp. ZC-5]